MSGIPAIDLFAGPGGLGEGFSQAGFDVRLSIEMDPYAHSTLELRSMVRRLRQVLPSSEIGRLLCKQLGPDELRRVYEEHPDMPPSHAWQATLGATPHEVVADRIDAALGNAKEWILLGGPPCQAYSLAGRSRMRTTRPDFDSDHRHFLYREYLRIVADFAPPVFLVENVKGLLSSTVGGVPIFDRILHDLQRPRQSIDCNPRRLVGKEVEYELRPIVLPDGSRFDGLYAPADFIVRAEEHGVPQARHRVLILGIRKPAPDIGWLERREGRPLPVRHAIDDLPPLYAGVSNRSSVTRCEAFEMIQGQAWLEELRINDHELVARILEAAEFTARARVGASGNYKSPKERAGSKDLVAWLTRNKPPHPLNHESRSHIPEDLHRYLFCACHAELHRRVPKLEDFPRGLLPQHKNVDRNGGKTIFADRFRVQAWDGPSTTVTSHISKDGHYYIHPDPRQARSLSVREAARLQTFPDDYLFCGPRTEQYKQVGNAVPPYLAFQVATLLKPAFEKPWKPPHTKKHKQA
jgi:DNA (cytosine-5)-methyltransferase 1